MTDQKIYQECVQLIKCGEYRTALSRAEGIHHPALKGAILIDAGAALEQSKKVQEGIMCFENLLQEQKPVGYQRKSFLYNAGNGYYALYKIRAKRRKKTVAPNDPNLRAAKKKSREAINEISPGDEIFASQVFVNYGNCLSQLGRFAEAIEQYYKSLIADPENGMAAGNLGIELKHCWRIMGKFQHEYLALAQYYLKHAFSNEMHLNYGSKQAINCFKLNLQEVNSIIQAHKKSINLPVLTSAVDFKQPMRDFLEFCIQNGLFLNAWVGENIFSPGIIDDIHFGPIITSTDDNETVPELLHVLNEIKEAFSSARYLFFLSQQKQFFLDQLSGMTIFFNFQENNINGIYPALCKTAYIRAFNILDKVARIINVYFKIGNRRDSFWNLFVEKQSHGKEEKIFFAVHPTIQNFENPSLYALSDICIDYFERHQVDLSSIDNRRNQITHDYLQIKDSISTDEDKQTISMGELYNETLEVLHIAKFAIIYAMNAININELRKTKTEETLLVEYDDKPGDPNNLSQKDI
jgi:tetratricopeptide (TPR) repeat protein